MLCTHTEYGSGFAFVFSWMWTPKSPFVPFGVPGFSEMFTGTMLPFVPMETYCTWPFTRWNSRRTCSWVLACGRMHGTDVGTQCCPAGSHTCQIPYPKEHSAEKSYQCPSMI